MHITDIVLQYCFYHCGE